MNKPQSENTYIAEQKRICQTEWFKDHVATWIDKPANGLIGNGALLSRSEIVLD